MRASRPPKGFRVRSRRKVLENAVFDVFFDHLQEGSREVRDFLVIRPKRITRQGVTGAAILPVLPGGRLALLSIWRHTIGRWALEIPKGFLDPGEPERRAAARELAEETGFSCRPSAMRPLGGVVPDAGIFEAKVRLFAAVGCRAGGAGRSWEIAHGELRDFAPAEVRRMIADSTIEDPYTIVAFHRWEARR